jgi:hypothetical protein
MSASVTPQLPIAPADEAAGRACFEAFAAAMAEWIPTPAEWTKLSWHVQEGWIAGAKAARALS